MYSDRRWPRPSGRWSRLSDATWSTRTDSWLTSTLCRSTCCPCWRGVSWAPTSGSGPCARRSGPRPRRSCQICSVSPARATWTWPRWPRTWCRTPAPAPPTWRARSLSAPRRAWRVRTRLPLDAFASVRGHFWCGWICDEMLFSCR